MRMLELYLNDGIDREAVRLKCLEARTQRTTKRIIDEKSGHRAVRKDLGRAAQQMRKQFTESAAMHATTRNRRPLAHFDTLDRGIGFSSAQPDRTHAAQHSTRASLRLARSPTFILLAIF